MGVKSQRFCLTWNEFGHQMQSIFQNMYEAKTFADVTLICENKTGDVVEILAHRLVLSMCSHFLKTILFDYPENHPIITVDGVQAEDLQNVLQFMYMGRVSVRDVDLSRFLDVAELLKIDGIDKKQYGRFLETPDFFHVEHCRNSPQELSDPAPLNLSKSSPTYEWSSSPVPVLEEDQEKDRRSLLRPPGTIRPWMSPSLERHSSHSNSLDLYHENMSFPSPRDLTRNPDLLKLSAAGYSGIIPSQLGQKPLSRPSPHPYMRAWETQPFMRPFPSPPMKKPSPPPRENLLESPPIERPIIRKSGRKSLLRDSSNIELFTTPTGMIVTTAFGLKPDASISPGNAENVQMTSPLVMMSNMVKIPLVSPLSGHAAPSLTNSAASSELLNSAKATSHHLSSKSYHKGIKYTPAQVRAIVQSVEDVAGPCVPCKICSKVVKRERLRTHIYECHLINNEKIHCPYCNVALKSKGSYRVHVWRHRKGNLKKSGKMKNKQPKVVDA